MAISLLTLPPEIRTEIYKEMVNNAETGSVLYFHDLLNFRSSCSQIHKESDALAGTFGLVTNIDIRSALAGIPMKETIQSRSIFDMCYFEANAIRQPEPRSRHIFLNHHRERISRIISLWTSAGDSDLLQMLQHRRSSSSFTTLPTDLRNDIITSRVTAGFDAFPTKECRHRSVTASIVASMLLSVWEESMVGHAVSMERSTDTMQQYVQASLWKLSNVCESKGDHFAACIWASKSMAISYTSGLLRLNLDMGRIKRLIRLLVKNDDIAGAARVVRRVSEHQGELEGEDFCMTDLWRDVYCVG